MNTSIQSSTQRLVLNFFSLSLAELLGQVFSFILTVTLARQYGATIFGQYSLAVVYGAFFGLFIELGMTKIILRETAKDQQASNIVISNALLIRIIATLPTVLLNVLVAFAIGYSPDVYLFILLASIVSSLQILLMTFRIWFQGFELMVIDGASRILERGITTIIGLLLIGLGVGIEWLFISNIIVLVLIIMLLWNASNRRLVKLSISNINWPMLKYLLKVSPPLILSTLLVSIYFRSDALMISIFKDETEVGYYNVAYNLILSVSIVAGIYFHSIFPLSRDETMANLLKHNIESRPFFYPMHILPIYEEMMNGEKLPIAEDLAARGISLPSSAKLTRDDVEYIAQTLIELAGR